MMRFASLGSGSRGNATLVQAGATAVLIDCGFTVKETLARLAALDFPSERLAAILVTHEHADHGKGVLALSRRLGVPFHMSPGTAIGLKCLDHPGLRLFDAHVGFTLGELWVQPVAVPHDARENCQFVLRYQATGQTFGILTDLGHVTSHVTASFAGLDALLLEANHDPDLLARGPYPASLKRRVGGPYGHLSNQQSADLLRAVDHPDLQHVMISHISEQNNDASLARDILASAIPERADRLRLNTQDSGHTWCLLEAVRGPHAKENIALCG